MLMQGQFDRALRDAYRFVDNALIVISPELADNDVRHRRRSTTAAARTRINPRPPSLTQAERLKRLARFSMATMKAQSRIHQKVKSQATLRHIHDSALACKLELFRCV